MTTIQNAKKELVIKALLKHEGNRKKAAHELGVSVRSIRNYILVFGIDIPVARAFKSQFRRGKARGELYKGEAALVLLAQSVDVTTAARIIAALEHVKAAIKYLNGENDGSVD